MRRKDTSKWPWRCEGQIDCAREAAWVTYIPAMKELLPLCTEHAEECQAAEALRDIPKDLEFKIPSRN